MHLTYQPYVVDLRHQQTGSSTIESTDISTIALKQMQTALKSNMAKCVEARICCGQLEVTAQAKKARHQLLDAEVSDMFNGLLTQEPCLGSGTVRLLRLY